MLQLSQLFSFTVAILFKTNFKSNSTLPLYEYKNIQIKHVHIMLMTWWWLSTDPALKSFLKAVREMDDKMQMMELAWWGQFRSVSTETTQEIWPKPKLSTENPTETKTTPKLSLLPVLVPKRNRKRNLVVPLTHFSCMVTILPTNYTGTLQQRALGKAHDRRNGGNVKKEKDGVQIEE